VVRLIAVSMVTIRTRAAAKVTVQILADTGNVWPSKKPFLWKRTGSILGCTLLASKHLVRAVARLLPQLLQ
jgi:hypothetical protein